MNKLTQLFTFFLLTNFSTSLIHAGIDIPSSPSFPINKTEQNETLQFTPPPEWRNSDNTALPTHVKLMIVGKGTQEFPPSISIATENYSGTIKQYLKVIKDLNTSKGQEWRDLGTLKTGAGNTSLSQTDSKSQWGDIRMMHVILKKNGIVYIVTAAALKEEFHKFYKEIFNALRSLHFSPSG